MTNIFNIVKSRFIKGENLPGWYESRLKICSECPLNSKNIEKKDKSSARKSWELIAGAHCTDPSCGCTITQKAKIESEYCPKNKWLSIKSEKQEVLNLTLNSNKASMTFQADSNKYIVDYGEIPFQFESSIDLLLKDKGLENISVGSTCGCTTAKPKYIREGIIITVKYDTLRIGSFDKNVIIDYTKKGKQNRTIVNIKGNVKNN